MASPELSSLLSHIFSVVWWVGAKENDLRERMQVREGRVSNLTSYRTASRAQCTTKANLRERMQLRWLRDRSAGIARVSRRCPGGASPIARAPELCRYG